MTNLIRLDLSYVGTHFQGWQSQTHQKSIQDRLEAVLQTVLRHPVRVLGASRTDSGVHAEHQVATFQSDAHIEPRRLMKSLNSLLPKDVGVLSVTTAPKDFHPILSCVGKAYRYRIWRGAGRLAYLDPFCWRVHAPLNMDILRTMADQFRGTHDFSSFCASDSSAKTRERTIFDIAIDERGPLIDIWVVGNGFLKQMVRSMVGTLIELASGASTGSISEILATKDRTKAGATAPAHGLSLVRIFYDQVYSCSNLIKECERGFCFSLLP